MPLVGLKDNDREGDYRVKFSRGKTVDFYGQTITEFQAFRRRAALSDHNVLGNKLVNTLATGLLQLERDAHEIETSMPDDALRKERLFYAGMEREVVAFHSCIFEELSVLEKTRALDGNNSIKNVEAVRFKIDKLYDARLKYIDAQIKSIQGDDNSSKIQRSRYQQLKDQVESHRSDVLKQVKEGANLETVYRKVLDTLAAEEREVSVYQPKLGNPLANANYSRTEIYNNAAHEMEQHVFSSQNPTDKQLWLIDRVKQQCKISKLDKMPQNLADYVGQYIVCDDKLVYISAKQEVHPVPIKNLDIFKMQVDKLGLKNNESQTIDVDQIDKLTNSDGVMLYVTRDLPREDLINYKGSFIAVQDYVEKQRNPGSEAAVNETDTVTKIYYINKHGKAIQVKTSPDIKDQLTQLRDKDGTGSKATALLLDSDDVRKLTQRKKNDPPKYKINEGEEKTIDLWRDKHKDLSVYVGQYVLLKDENEQPKLYFISDPNLAPQEEPIVNHEEFLQKLGSYIPNQKGVRELTREEICDCLLHDFVLDTGRYPSMRKEDALLAAFLVEPPPNTDPHEAFKKQKEEITAASKLRREKDEQDRAKDDIFQRSVVRAEQEQQTDTITTAGIPNFLRSLGIGETSSPASTPHAAEFLKGASLLSGEEPLHLYEQRDLLTCIGMAAVTISKYFESEMAAKDPELTLALFVAMGVTFGAAGLAAGGSASMKGVVGLMSKILTLNGKIGISATQMQGAIGAISDEWMRLTFTEGTMKTIIMNGFALPKVIYAFGNLMLKSSDKKDVFHRITTRLETQDLAGYTDKEKAAQLRTEIMVGTLLFAASIALGLGATTLAGLGTSGFLPTVGHYVGTGVSLLVDVKPEVFLDVGTASGLGAEFVAIAAMILTIKSSALFLGKVALVLGHMSGEECSKEEREICMMMASIKDGLDTGKIREEDLVGKIDTPEFQSWRSKLVGLIEKNDEVRDLYDTDDGRDFLIKIGAEVTPKPLLNRFLSTSKTIFWDYVAVKGIGQPLYAIISSVLRIPAIVLGFGTLWDFNNKGELSFRWGKDRADWKGLRGLENASDPLGFKEASWKPVMFLTKLAITVSALIKTVTISTWGTLQSVGMATTDLLADIAATVNYMMRRFRPDIPGGTVIGIGLGIVFGAVLFAEKLLFTGLSIANKIVDFGLKAVGYATTIVTGVVGLIATAIIGPFVRGIGGKDAFNTFWNGMKEFMKGPVTLSELWNEHVYKPFKAAFAEIIQGMDQEIYSVKGSDKIVSVRDQATGGIARIFDWVKEKAGEVAYGVRNFFVRSQEHHLQITHKQEMDAIDSQIEEEVDELRDCIMIDESEHMQGLGAAGVDKGKDDMEDRLKKLKEPEPQQDLVTVLGSSVIDDYQPEPAALRQS